MNTAMKKRYILLLMLCVPVWGFGQCQDPVFISMRSAKKDCVGQRAEFEVSAENVVSYQWQAANPSTPNTWFNLSFESTNTSKLSFVTDMAWNHYGFRCKLTGPCSEIYTPTAWIFVYQSGPSHTPVITGPNTSTRSVPENSTIQLELKTTQDWGYQWQYSTSATGAWFDLKNEEKAELLVTTFPDRSGYRYRCMVKGCPSAYSGAVTLNVVPSGIPNDFNFIKQTVFLKKADLNTDVIHLPVEDKAVTINYFDGLGRTMQTVGWQASPGKKDLVQPTVYDQYGREVRQYLPFTGTQSNGNYIYNHSIISTSGEYAGPAAGFYAPGSANDVADDTKPWAETILENSPMNRILKQGAPGAAWQPDKYNDDHAIQYKQKANVAGEVLLWEVVNDHCTLSSKQYYDPNELYVSETRDENWQSADGDHGVVKEYSDRRGRTILKRIYLAGEAYDTYYVYDELNNLRFTLPPEGIKQMLSNLPPSEQ
jgi:hypothetical protein